MKLKLDENLGRSVAERIRLAGHDVATVHQEGLCSATDPEVIEACRKERRCLVTLDLGFANPLVFDPAAYTGIAVFRLPAKPTSEDLSQVIETLLAELAREQISGRLWIVERRRIRQYQGKD